MRDFDIVVVGGTPGGIAAAIAAARHGRRVALTEYHTHIGGMATSGLGKSDIEDRRMIGGIFGEFVERIRAQYAERYGTASDDYRLCNDGYYYEPSVAERCFDSMVAAEPGITLFRGARFEFARTEGERVVAVACPHRVVRVHS